MSADIVVCPHCGTNLQNSERIAGQIVACPQCRAQLQMPVWSHPVPVPPLLPPSALPPVVEHLLPARAGTGARPGSAIPGPVVRAERAKRGAEASVADRLRKRSNPWVIGFTVVMVVVLIAVGTVSYLGTQADKSRRQFEKQLIGNWELVPGQSQLERWDFAFHSDGQLQMALGNQLTEGRWRVTSVRGATGYVLLEWPDDAPETMRVDLASGTLRISLESVGSFGFRAAAP